MAKVWDGDVAMRVETWAEVYRVLKPGAQLVAFGGTRTFHRMMCAIEDAGFELRDTLAWLYGSGFPKSHNLDGDWKGWGTALKPAHEPIILARKPFPGTVARNVLAHGTGAINVDACRVPILGDRRTPCGADGDVHRTTGNVYGAHERSVGFDTTKARWPANVVHDGSPEVEAAFAAFGVRASCNSPSSANPEGSILGGRRSQGAIYPGDSGTASRFFYSAKATARDRADSKHPTVKPIALMRWLVRLVTPPEGVVLDCFAGSGTTGEAALREGFDAILIEQEAAYIVDIERRLAPW